MGVLALQLTALRMAAADLVQTNGFGVSLCSAMVRLIDDPAEAATFQPAPSQGGEEALDRVHP